jgi:hypothetical protein
MPPVSPKVPLAAFWAGVAAAIIGLWTAAPARLRPDRPLPEGVRSPMLALELLRERDRARVADFVDPPDLAVSDAGATAAHDRPAREHEQLLDAVRRDAYFIAAYDTFLTLAGTLLIRTPFGAPLVAAANVAAYYDVEENRRITGVLHGWSGPVPREPSIKKWTFVFISFLLMTPALLVRRGSIFWRTLGLAGAAFAVIGAVEGLLSIIDANDQLLESAAGRLTVAFACATLFFGARGVLADGVLPALDRLAATRWLGWLSRWPPSEPQRR